MKTRIWKKLLLPCLIITMLASTIQPGLANFTTKTLISDSVNILQQAKSKGGSFSFEGHTYKYGISAGLEYNEFDHLVTSDFCTGFIRVCGGACINNPPGARQLGVLRLKTELILNDYYCDIWGNRKTKENAAGSEIHVWYSQFGTVNLAIVGPGDQALRNLLTVVGSVAWTAMCAMAEISMPFWPAWIAFLDSGGKYDQDCGGGLNRDADVYVQGVSGWQYPAWKTWCPSEAEVSYGFEFGYSRRDVTGYKLYKLTIKISVDFGYVTSTYQGTFRNVVLKTYTFQEGWNVYVYWPPK